MYFFVFQTIFNMNFFSEQFFFFKLYDTNLLYNVMPFEVGNGWVVV